MANIFEFLSKDGNITPEKARKSRQMPFHDKTAYVWMGMLPLKKRVNRDKCSFATKQRMFGVFAIDEILRYRGTRFPGSRTLCHPALQFSIKSVRQNDSLFFCLSMIIIGTIHLKNEIEYKTFAKSAWGGKVNILRGNVCKTGQLPCILSNIGFCCEFLWRLQQSKNLSLPQRPLLVIWWVGDDRT